MKYALLVYESPEDTAILADPVKGPELMAAYFAYSSALDAAGVSVGGAGLQPPSTATTVRVRNGKRLVQDGPFAETKEQLGGFFLIDVPDLDTALMWAARCPGAATASIEVRAVLPEPPDA